MTSKHAQKHLIEKSEKFIHWKNFKSKKLRKWPKKGQKWLFFGPGGPNCYPFFKIFGNSLLNMPKNISNKIHLLEKFVSPKNSENGQNRAKNGCFFALEGLILTLF